MPLILLRQILHQALLLLVHAPVEQQGLLDKEGIVEGRVKDELRLGQA